MYSSAHQKPVARWSGTNQFGPANRITNVYGSGVSTRIGSPWTRHQYGGLNFSRLSLQSWYQKARSSEVNSTPSDHLRPRRKWIVSTLPSRLNSHDRASPGSTPVQSARQ